MSPGVRHLETDRIYPAFKHRGCDRRGGQQGSTRFIGIECAGRHDSRVHVQLGAEATLTGSLIDGDLFTWMLYRYRESYVFNYHSIVSSECTMSRAEGANFLGGGSV
jgi:hypothetical protein